MKSEKRIRTMIRLSRIEESVICLSKLALRFVDVQYLEVIPPLVQCCQRTLTLDLPNFYESSCSVSSNARSMTVMNGRGSSGRVMIDVGYVSHANELEQGICVVCVG